MAARVRFVALTSWPSRRRNTDFTLLQRLFVRDVDRAENLDF
jgi:hypothetical protein